MRIAIVDRWAGGADGPGVYVRELGQGLIECGHTAHLLYGELRGEERVAGFEQQCIPGLAASQPSRGASLGLQAALSRLKPDVVIAECLDVPWWSAMVGPGAFKLATFHTHTATCPNWSRVLWRWDRLCDRDFSPICAVYHFAGGCGRGAGVRTLVRGLYRCALARRHLRRFDGVHALNAYMEATFKRAGVPDSKILTAQYPAPFFEEGADWVGRDPEPRQLLFVGRLDREKGFHVLLRAIRQLKIPTRLRVLGSPELDRGLDGASSDRLHGQCEVEFLGHVSSRADLSSQYGRAAIVVVPSIWGDPSPLVRLEAMAHGRPLVAFDSGGVGSVIEHGATGLLVNRGDEAGLAAAITTLLEQPQRAREMGRAARRKVELEFTRRGHVDAVLDFVGRQSSLVNARPRE